MEIPITTLQQMLTNAATLGAMSAVKKLDPVKDELKASEVRVWLGNDSKMGHDQGLQERHEPELTLLLFEVSDRSSVCCGKMQRPSLVES